MTEYHFCSMNYISRHTKIDRAILLGFTRSGFSIIRHNVPLLSSLHCVCHLVDPSYSFALLACLKIAKVPLSYIAHQQGIESLPE